MFRMLGQGVPYRGVFARPISRGASPLTIFGNPKLANVDSARLIQDYEAEIGDPIVGLEPTVELRVMAKMQPSVASLGLQQSRFAPWSKYSWNRNFVLSFWMSNFGRP
ncbi:hypothetical protein COCNU_contig69309963G000010 [Cocos nucifera]|nr:hypothetical protein [Cocos nucifera]